MDYTFTHKQVYDITAKLWELDGNDLLSPEQRGLQLVQFALSLIPDPAPPEPAPQSFWRLLEPGKDVWREGDQFAGIGSYPPLILWMELEAGSGTVGSTVTEKHRPGRRRAALPTTLEWISLKERKPQRKDGDRDGFIAFLRCGELYFAGYSSADIEGYTHWLPGKVLENLPRRAAPEPADKDREDFEAIYRHAKAFRVFGFKLMDYSDEHIQARWEGFKAARSSSK